MKKAAAIRFGEHQLPEEEEVEAEEEAEEEVEEEEEVEGQQRRRRQRRRRHGARQRNVGQGERWRSDDGRRTVRIADSTAEAEAEAEAETAGKKAGGRAQAARRMADLKKAPMSSLQLLLQLAAPSPAGQTQAPAPAPAPALAEAAEGQGRTALAALLETSLLRAIADGILAYLDDRGRSLFRHIAWPALQHRLIALPDFVPAAGQQVWQGAQQLELLLTNATEPEVVLPEDDQSVTSHSMLTGADSTSTLELLALTANASSQQSSPVRTAMSVPASLGSSSLPAFPSPPLSVSSSATTISPSHPSALSLDHRHGSNTHPHPHNQHQQNQQQNHNQQLLLAMEGRDRTISLDSLEAGVRNQPFQLSSSTASTSAITAFGLASGEGSIRDLPNSTWAARWRTYALIATLGLVGLVLVGFFASRPSQLVVLSLIITFVLTYLLTPWIHRLLNFSQGYRPLGDERTSSLRL